MKKSRLALHLLANKVCDTCKYFICKRCGLRKNKPNLKYSTCEKWEKTDSNDTRRNPSIPVLKRKMH